MQLSRHNKLTITTTDNSTITCEKNKREKKQQITSSTPPIEYFKTRRKADVLSPFDFAVGNTTSSPTTTQKAHETNQALLHKP